jgi:hypothetical protein
VRSRSDPQRLRLDQGLSIAMLCLRAGDCPIAHKRENRDEAGGPKRAFSGRSCHRSEGVQYWLSETSSKSSPGMGAPGVLGRGSEGLPIRSICLPSAFNPLWSGTQSTRRMSIKTGEGPCSTSPISTTPVVSIPTRIACVGFSWELTGPAGKRPSLALRVRVCSERWFFGRARLLPSRLVLRNGLGRSLALPLEEQTLCVFGMQLRSEPGMSGDRFLGRVRSRDLRGRSHGFFGVAISGRASRAGAGGE